MSLPIKFFTDNFNITVSDIEKLLAVALSRGGDYADLYFEYAVLSNLSLEEQLIKSANRAITQGVGVRVIAGHAAFKDRRTVVVGDQFEIRARRFVIATGSSPAVPPIPGLDAGPFLTNETIFNLTERPRQLIIITGTTRTS